MKMLLQIFTCVILFSVVNSLGINGNTTNIDVNNSLVHNLIQKSREILKGEDGMRLHDVQKNITCPKEDGVANEFLLNLLNGSALGLTDYEIGSDVKILIIDEGFYKIEIPLIFNEIQIKYAYESNQTREIKGLITANINNLRIDIDVRFKTGNVPDIHFKQYSIGPIKNIDVNIRKYINGLENECLKKATRKFFEFVIREEVMRRFLSSIQDSMNYHLLFRV